MPLRTSLSLLAPLGMVMAVLLLVVGTATAVVRWWLFDEAGSQWLVQRLPLIQVQGFRGALLGPSWQADRVHLTWENGKASLTIEGLSASGMQWSWRPHEQAWLGLRIEQLAARKLVVQTGPKGKRPLPAPASVAPPLDLEVQALQLTELVVDQLSPVRDLRATGLVLDAKPGASHRLEQAQAQWQQLHLQLKGSIVTAAPQALDLQALVRASGVNDQPLWAAVIRAQGNLPRPEITGTLRGVPAAGREPPALDVKAVLQPLQAWPLQAFSLHTQELDLSALSAKAPQTRLSGVATLAPRIAGAPLAANIDLRNTMPGRWNERRLPVQQIVAQLSGDVQQPDRLEVPRFEVTLSDSRQAAGRFSGSASWRGHELQVDSRLQDVVPQRVDGRAAGMVFSGPLALGLRGLPSPTGAAPPSPANPTVSWKLDLVGNVDATARSVQLRMQGQASDSKLEVTQLQAVSGSASAELKAVLQRAGAGDWRLESSGGLINFDPVPWWPGETGSTWRLGPHRLSAKWDMNLRLPGNSADLPAVELLQRLSGNGNLRVEDSLLAGVPLAADIRMGYTQAASPAAAQLRADLSLGGNTLVVEGRGDPTGAGLSDRWRADLTAANLNTLGPLTKLHPALAEWLPRQGSANATIAADGRWPNLQTEGTARVQLLQMGALSLANGQVTWRLDSAGERNLSMRLSLAGLQSGEQRMDHVTAQVSGQLADHQIEIYTAVPLRPPAVLAKALGVMTQSGTRGQLQGRGAWTTEAAGGGRWKARIDRLTVGSWDGAASDAPPASLWMQARDLKAELLFGGGGQLLWLQADPGRVQFGDNVTLRWDEVQADWRGAHPLLQLRADIDPFALAPLLARWQPQMGWAGDIRLGARVDIRAGQRFDADLVFERRDGDLHISSGEGMQLLGLTDLKLSLSAHDGVWLFNPVFKGRSLGEITGSARVQTTPEARWPHSDAPLQGDVQARVADIGIWGAWVPPGWRMTGELRTKATLGGRFGEPRYTGDLTGTALSVRNLLQGVNVTDGQISVRLEGDKATIDRFTLKGGDGLLSVTGGATLGTTPQAQLQIKADRFRAIGRVDRTVIASGQTELIFGRDKAQLEGRIVLDEGVFDFSRSDAPSLDEDVTVRRPGDADPTLTDPRQAGPRSNLVVGLDLDLGQNLRLRGRGVDTGLRGKLRLSNPGGRWNARGTIQAVEGTYAAYGQKLTVERGLVAFGGPVDDPRLDILALRPNIDTRVGVAITGTAQTPRVRLFSDPDMSDTEKLSWLVLGRAPDGLGRADTALLQRAAVALLAGEGEAPTDTLLKSLGIDEIGLKQSDGEVRETVITLGKQLSRRWYVGYERGVNSTIGTWQLIYRIAQRFTVRAQSGLENSLDVIWTWRFQETPADAAMRKSTVTPP
jgi:translocation and assembly module TamB